MEKLGLNEIRERYLSFFESKGHLRLPSFGLVPKDDPSVLLINAGMTPLKPYFTGREVPPKKRVTTCQKCIRTPDIERVGKTARHGTFFEMLGNFSFGDYFKKEAIAWAWEFVTVTMKMDVDKLWVTVYQDDDEAFDIWQNDIGVDPEHIVRMGKEDNFWEHGLGPCGPCSEIYFDRGEKFSCGKHDCKMGCDCDRYVEFWNLVFTQFDKDDKGNYNRLPNPNIDTGMGLERLAVIMQGVHNLFEVDTIKNIMDYISSIAGIKYGDSEKSDVSLRVITDHIRSTCFMISDGIIPSNEGRGYVLRRLLRRAARHGKLLGINHTFLHDVVDIVIKESGKAYPNLLGGKEYIKKIIKLEEERFDETIDQGLSILEGYTNKLKEQNETVLDGKSAFKLYDTYGFPLDLTLDILEEQGLKVDEEGFKVEMQHQRETAKAAGAKNVENAWSKGNNLKLDVVSKFIGYDDLKCEAVVTAIIKNGEIAEKAVDGDDVIIITDKTVFYAESGGQAGDSGKMFGAGFFADVIDSHKISGVNAHAVHINEGVVELGSVITLEVDEQKRRSTMRNHSATHLLQKALQEVLGAHVAQSGSFVNTERLRFDFSHFEAMTKEQLLEVENRVNDKILEALTVTKQEMSIDDARKIGAMALFGEKYGDRVRVVKMGEYSIELCGGCHVSNTGEVGLFKIMSEAGVAAGVRRIEAVTGRGVLQYIKAKEDLIDEAADIIKAAPTQVIEKLKAVMQAQRDSQAMLDKVHEQTSKKMADDVLKELKEVNGVSVITAFVGNISVDDMRMISDSIKEKLDTVVIMLASENEGKVNFVGSASKNAVSKGIHVGKIIKEVAAVAGGSGGGKPDSAQAGGKDKEKINDALSIVCDMVSKQLGGE